MFTPFGGHNIYFECIYCFKGDERLKVMYVCTTSPVTLGQMIFLFRGVSESSNLRWYFLWSQSTIWYSNSLI
jgi:hypothetical protein